MALLGSLLPSLRLFLCLGMLFIPASSANDSDSCMSFNAVIPTTTGIRASSDVYEDNKVYTILVPVSSRTSSVVLRALDTNNNSIGFWHRADQTCNNSVLYSLRGTYEETFQASWTSPPSTNVTTVEIQAFAVNVQKMATFSSLKLRKPAVTTPSYSMISTTRPTTTRILTTARNLYPTTTKSLGTRIFLSPITDAIQILLVFLTSKLLF